MVNEADTESDPKTVDKVDTGADMETADEVEVQTRRRETRWTQRRWMERWWTDKIAEDVDKEGRRGGGAECRSKALGSEYGRMSLIPYIVHCRMAGSKGSMSCKLAAPRCDDKDSAARNTALSQTALRSTWRAT